MIKNLSDLEATEKTVDLLGGAPASTLALIERGASQGSHQLALRFIADPTQITESTDWTFSDLLHHIRQAANLLHDAGAASNDVVSIILPNSPTYHALLWGAQTAAIANPVNPLLEPSHMAEIMDAAQTTILVTCCPGDAQGIGERALEAASQISSLTTIFLVPSSSEQSPALPDKLHVLGWEKERSRYRGDTLDFVRTDTLHAPAAYFHTGGTTGAPKLAVLTHANMIASVTAVRFQLPMSHDSVGLCGLPLFHINGVIATGLLPWSAGASVVLAGPLGYRNPALLSQFWQAIEHYKVSYFSGVPTIYQSFADLPLKGCNLSSLSYAICGAAPLPPEIRRRFEKHAGIPILEGYGLTEGACISTINPLVGETASASIGMRLLGQQMKAAVLTEAGQHERDCVDGEPGVILIRGPNVFKGYLDEGHNEAAWIADPEGGAPWFNTGDLGYRNDAGFWWLAGRRKELIIRGGHNIDPLIIELALLKHPAVAAAAAVARPDPRVGEVPVAYVQLRASPSISEADLLAFATQTIPERAAHPKTIHIIEQIPLTAVGKPFKPALVWREISDVVEFEVARAEGLKLVSVSVNPDKKRGAVADIYVYATAAGEQSLRHNLSNYAFAFNLTTVV